MIKRTIELIKSLYLKLFKKGNNKDEHEEYWGI